MERTHIQDLFAKKAGEKVLLRGWAYDLRDLKKVRFIVLKDMTGRVQVTAVSGETSEENFKLMNEVSRESALEIVGTIKDCKQAPGGKEIAPEKITILAKAESPLPIDVSDYSKTELPIRLDWRFLDMHRDKTQAIFKIQNEITNAFREHFYKKGFIEMQPPCIIGAASEGGTELFEVKYFEKKAFLAQSPQLYKQMLACSMEKTFTVTPVWRAEKHNTTRHINEIRQMDIEVAFMNQMDIMKQQEEVVKDIVEKVLKNCKKELELVGRKDLKVPKAVYLHYEDAIKKVGGKIGEDFTPEQERVLCEMYPGDMVFTHSWPASIKPFYIMPTNEDPKSKESQGFDMLYGGVEISSGGTKSTPSRTINCKTKNKGL